MVSICKAQVTVPTCPEAALPPSNAGAPGSLALVSDGIRGLRVDTGTQWVGIFGNMVNVKEFGATGEGSVDDGGAIRAAIQAASAKKTTVFFPPGTYVVKPNGSNTYALSLASNIQLVGSGREATVIKLGKSVGTSTRVLYGTDLSNVTIRDLSVDGNKSENSAGTVNMDGIYLNNASKISMRNVAFQNTVGNGVTLSGASDRVMVEGNFFSENGRNGVFVRGGSNVLIAKNCFSGSTPNAIQVATVSGSNHDYSITGNIIESSVAHGMKISGVSLESPIRGVSIQGNLLQGNGIDVIWTEGLDITGNEIRGSDTGAVSPILLSRYVFNARISGNEIVGKTAGLLSIIAVSSSDLPKGITVTGNTLSQLGAFPGIDLRGVSDINIDSNIVRGSGGGAGISIYSTLPMESINVSGNMIKNFTTGVWTIKYSTNRIKNLVLSANMLGDDQVTPTQLKGIDLSPGSGVFIDGLVMAGNSMANSATSPLLINAGQLYSSSGNMRTQTELSGTGSPEGVVSAPVGSTYLRRDEGTGFMFYVKETGTGNTGWIGK